MIADEAELLTLAVAPQARRQGIARSLTTEFSATALSKGGRNQFLEVAADNLPALSLYKSLNWRELGRRKGYYGPGLDAIVMKLTASPPTVQSSGSPSRHCITFRYHSP